MLSKLIQNIISSPTISGVVAGVLLGIGFIVPMLWWVSFFGMAFLLKQVASIKSTKLSCRMTYIAWSVKSAFALAWFWYGYPLDWIAIPSAIAQIAVICFYWLTSAAWLGFGGVFFALAARYLINKIPKAQYLLYLVLPLLWLLGELVASAIFSFFTLGPGSFIQTYFSFGQVGYLLGGTQLGLFLAGIAGVYGLTMAVTGIGVIGWQLFERRHTTGMYQAGIGLCMVLLGFSFFYHPHYQTQNITINAINTEFDSVMLGQSGGFELKTEILDEALRASLGYPAEYILLPEDSRYFSSFYGTVSPKALVSQFEFINGSTSAVIIDSGREELENGQTVLRATIFDGQAKTVHQFDKQYLVPQGEYVPYLYGAVMRLIGFGEAVEGIALDSSYSPGSLQQTGSLPGYIPGVLFCFESVRPDGVTSLTKKRAVPFIAHPISHGWFHQPTLMWQQLDVMLTIQARYSGVPIVSAGNMTQGKAYLPNGEIQKGEKMSSGKLYQVYRLKI
jgi:apolipoprotein N-acyltransferase